MCASEARARRAALAALAPCAIKGHCKSEKPPFLLRKAVLPRSSPAPHFARWLARVLARHCALSLLGRGPARALATCARPAALVEIGPC